MVAILLQTVFKDAILELEEMMPLQLVANTEKQ